MTLIVVACKTVSNLQAKCIDAQFGVRYLPIHNAVFIILYKEKRKGFVSHNRAAILSGVSVE